MWTREKSNICPLTLLVTCKWIVVTGRRHSLEIPDDARAVVAGRDALCVVSPHLDARHGVLVLLEREQQRCRGDGGESSPRQAAPDLPHAHAAFTATAHDVATVCPKKNQMLRTFVCSLPLAEFVGIGIAKCTRSVTSPAVVFVLSALWFWDHTLPEYPTHLSTTQALWHPWDEPPPGWTDPAHSREWRRESFRQTNLEKRDFIAG